MCSNVDAGITATGDVETESPVTTATPPWFIDIIADTQAWSVDDAEAAGTQTLDARAISVMPSFGKTEDIHSVVTDALDNIVRLIVQRSYIQAGKRNLICRQI